MPSGNVRSKPSDKWDQLMADCDECIDFLRNTAKRLLQELENIEQAIAELRPREQAILTSRYILGMEFSKIHKRFPVSERTMYQIHHDAITHLNMDILEWETP